MPLIEGIGDEVTVLATCLVVLAVLIIAWTSTRVDVRMHTSVIIIDRERFGELLRRVRGIAVRSGETDASVSHQTHSAASTAEAHALTDSMLVAGAAAADVKPSSDVDDADDYQSNDGEHRCLHEIEAKSSPDSSGDSCLKSYTDCADSASSLQVATAAVGNQNASQHISAISSDMPPGSIQVRLQFVDGRQRTVVANPDDTIGHFKR